MFTRLLRLAASALVALSVVACSNITSGNGGDDEEPPPAPPLSTTCTSLMSLLQQQHWHGPFRSLTRYTAMPIPTIFATS